MGQELTSDGLRDRLYDAAISHGVDGFVYSREHYQLTGVLSKIIQSPVLDAKKPVVSEFFNVLPNGEKIANRLLRFQGETLDNLLHLEFSVMNKELELLSEDGKDSTGFDGLVAAGKISEIAENYYGAPLTAMIEELRAYVEKNNYTPHDIEKIADALLQDAVKQVAYHYSTVQRYNSKKLPDVIKYIVGMAIETKNAKAVRDIAKYAMEHVGSFGSFEYHANKLITRAKGKRQVARLPRNSFVDDDILDDEPVHSAQEIEQD